MLTIEKKTKQHDFAQNLISNDHIHDNYPTLYGKHNKPLMLKSLKYSNLDQPNSWDTIGRTCFGPKNSPTSITHNGITITKTSCPTYCHYATASSSKACE